MHLPSVVFSSIWDSSLIDIEFNPQASENLSINIQIIVKFGSFTHEHKTSDAIVFNFSANALIVFSEIEHYSTI